MNIWLAVAMFFLMINIIGRVAVSVIVGEDNIIKRPPLIVMQGTLMLMWPSALITATEHWSRLVVACTILTWLVCGTLIPLCLGAPPLLAVMYFIVFAAFWTWTNSFLWES